MRKLSSNVVRVGVIGMGTVGSGVVKILRERAADIQRKSGVKLELVKVCVKSRAKKRAVKLPSKLVTTDLNDVLGDPSIDIVVELIGGVKKAKEIVHKAFVEGKHVVTANKALLAEEGHDVFQWAELHGCRLGIEASVCGGIPIIKALREGLASNEITEVLGIVNGTCNFILTAMAQRGEDFEAMLKEAQDRGFAEANPALDIDGVDSAHKLAIIARLAFRADVPFKKIDVQGIGGLSAADMEYALQLGYVIKLLAIAKKLNGALELRVHPTMLPYDHPLSNVRGVYNAVFVHSDQAGDQLYYGRGAGMMPTASAVVSDVIDIAKTVVAGSALRESASLDRVKVMPSDESVSKFYLRFQVADRPGVLGRLATTLGKHGISILSVHQKESHDPRSTPVIILTYEARERELRKALAEVDRLKLSRSQTVVIRVEK